MPSEQDSEVVNRAVINEGNSCLQLVTSLIFDLEYFPIEIFLSCIFKVDLGDAHNENVQKRPRNHLGRQLIRYPPLRQVL